MPTIVHDYSPDFKDNELKNVLLQLLAANPTAKKGKLFLDSAQNALKVSLNGTDWSTVATTDDLGEAGVSLETVVDTFGNTVLTEGTHVDLVYDDAANAGAGAITISLAATALDRANHTGTQTAATISDFVEAAQDAVGTILGDTATLDVAYNDAANTITLTVLDAPTVGGATAAQLRARSTHTGTQTASTISDLTEAVQDVVGAYFGDTATADVVYDDTLNTLVVNVLDSPTVAGNTPAQLRDRSTHTGTQAPATINFATTARLLGRSTAGAGTGEEISVGGGITLTAGALSIAAFTGDVTKTAGGTATTIAANAVTNTKAADMPANTIKGNNTGATADPKDLTVADVKALLALVAADISNFNTAADARVTATVTAAFINALTGVDADTLNGQTAAALQTAIVAAITDSAPGTLDTLNELAAALGDDPNFATTVTNTVATKNVTYAVTYGDGAATIFNIDHNIGTKDVTVQVRDVATGAQVFVDNRATTTSRVVIEHGTAPTAGQYRVVVQGRPD